MSIKVEDLKPGDVLYDVHSYRQLRYTLTGCFERASTEGCWRARVVYVHLDEDVPYAEISWNGNRPQRHYRTTSFKRWPKEWIRSAFRGRSCAMCHALEEEGHLDTCRHPRAISKRKRAAKEAGR